MLGIVLTLAVIGVLMYLLQNYVPMDARIKQIIYVVVVICVVFWLLNAFGVLAYMDAVPVPRLR